MQENLKWKVEVNSNIFKNTKKNALPENYKTLIVVHEKLKVGLVN